MKVDEAYWLPTTIHSDPPLLSIIIVSKLNNSDWSQITSVISSMCQSGSYRSGPSHQRNTGAKPGLLPVTTEAGLQQLTQMADLISCVRLCRIFKVRVWTTRAISAANEY